MVVANDVVKKGRVGFFSCIFQVLQHILEGKMYDLVVQVHFVSTMKVDRLKGDSSDAYLEKSCSSSEHL